MIIRTEHNGGLKGFLDRFREIGKPKVYIGVPASKNGMHEGGINMATLLAIHVLGAPSRGIKQRDPLRPPLQENAKEYSRLLAQGIKNNLANGEPIEQVYEKLGVLATNDVKAYFVNGQFEPLKKSTEKRKGSTKPLIDTGELRNSITYEIRK